MIQIWCTKIKTKKEAEVVWEWITTLMKTITLLDPSQIIPPSREDHLQELSVDHKMVMMNIIFWCKEKDKLSRILNLKMLMEVKCLLKRERSERLHIAKIQEMLKHLDIKNFNKKDWERRDKKQKELYSQRMLILRLEMHNWRKRRRSRRNLWKRKLTTGLTMIHHMLNT